MRGGWRRCGVIFPSSRPLKASVRPVGPRILVDGFAFALLLCDDESMYGCTCLLSSVQAEQEHLCLFPREISVVLSQDVAFPLFPMLPSSDSQWSWKLTFVKNEQNNRVGVVKRKLPTCLSGWKSKCWRMTYVRIIRRRIKTSSGRGKHWFHATGPHFDVVAFRLFRVANAVLKHWLFC